LLLLPLLQLSGPNRHSLQVVSSLGATCQLLELELEVAPKVSGQRTPSSPESSQIEPLSEAKVAMFEWRLWREGGQLVPGA